MLQVIATPHQLIQLLFSMAAASDFVLGDFSVDEHRPIKVVVIGAGVGGILAAIRSVAGTIRRLAANPVPWYAGFHKRSRTSS